MRAFVTIIHDAFRETIVSKTMWVLLALATLFLLGLAPLSIQERGPNRFDSQDFRDQDGLIREINRQAEEDKPNPGKRIAQIDGEDSPATDQKPAGADESKPAPETAPPRDEPGVSADDTASPDQSRNADATATANSRKFPRSGNLETSLNAVVKSRDLFDADAWAGVALGEEAQTLLDRGVESLEDKEVARLNRLLLEAAYGRFLNVASTKSYIGYAAWDWDEPLPVDKSQIVAPVLTFFTDNILGVFGVFIAILVTSTFVPRTFETGAIDLLLSKPVSRSLVFLAKFVGGCLFVFVLSTYVIVGLYLILGLRIGYWNHRFLWCIPLLFFLFAIYYSVSAMAGVIWRNAIVSVVVAMVFWAICFALGVTKAVFDANVMTSHRIYQLTDSGDTWFAAFRGSWGMPHGAYQRWDDDDDGDWVNAFTHGERDELSAPPWANRFDVMPVYHAPSKRLLAIGNLSGAKSDDTTGPWLLAAGAKNDWRQDVLGRLPKSVRQLVVRGDGKVVGLASGGIIEIPTPDQPLSAQQLEDRTSLKSLDCPDFEADAWALPSASAASGPASDILVYDPGRLRLLRLVDGKRYAAVATYEVAPPANCDPEALACAGGRAVLALHDGRMLVFDVKDRAFELLAAREASSDASVARQVRMAPGGKSFAVRREDRRVFWYDTDADASTAGEPISGGAQGDVTAIAMSADGRLAVAHAFNHLTVYEPDRSVASRITPNYSTPEAIYWRLLKPLYTVFPKPGELGNLAAYFVYGKETIGVPGNPDAPEEKLDIYTPLWSNLLFLSVMLGIGCLYVSRRDF